MIAGKWRVDALLGSGSMAAVYSVTHRNGARAALKILHPTLCADPAVCERFLGEGYLTNSVKHPGIVRVLDDGVTDDGCVYLVMDLLEGVTLEALRQERGGQIPLVEVLDIADELMDVLQAVHAAGVIHRDLKPQNVFVCHSKGRGRSVKLLDFGVARLFDQAVKSKLSVFGLVLGTPSFMAPEQAVGAREKVDHRTDIWSLGATLFTAITGQTVHLGPNVQAKLLAAATAKARSISMVKPDLPAPIAVAIDTALRFEQADRWQSVDAFRRALRDARGQAGLGTPESPAPPMLAVDDDPLPADAGERALAILVRTAQSEKSSSSGRGAAPKPPPLPREPRPKGPSGAWIGVAPDARRDEGPPPSPDRRDRPDVAVVQPNAVIRATLPLDEAPAAQESLPPVGGTLKLMKPIEGEPRRRRSSIASRLVGMVLGGAALGGLALFAVDHVGGGETGASAAELHLASAEVPVPLAQAPAPAAASQPETEADASASLETMALSAPVHTAHATPPAPVASGRLIQQRPVDRARAAAPRPHGAGATATTTPGPEPPSEGTPQGESPSAPESAPSRAPALPAPVADPFGTPE